ncbi:MAG: hypothetical protein LBC78_02195 [Oscillospiraceae bacterium]|jgi:hypothetical protein|nr:hypothetical protein [Oscillospiraceae bacterium]
MSNFNSNTEEIKFHARALLSDGQEKTTQEIINYAKYASGKAFTGGMISGAINDLIDRERAVYRRVRRGVYAKISEENQSAVGDAFDLIVKNAISEVEKARKIDIDSLTPAHLQQIQEKSRRIIAALESLLQ